MISEESREEIKKLEDRKLVLIQSIKKLNDRKKYKTYEQKALGPFVEKTKDVRTGNIRRGIKSVEFRIATQAYTPKKEKDLIKELKKLESDYSKVREVERARRKLSLVSSDLIQIDNEILKIEEELKKIRETLQEHYKKQKFNRFAKSKGVTIGRQEEEFSLMDLAQLEN
ncbi:MAG: hypothetical protein WC501_00225 [Candidatus Micrarchaeia archaeon]